MRVNVLLFGHYSDYGSGQPLEFDLPAPATLRQLLPLLTERDSRLKNLDGYCRFAVNEEYATLDDALTEGCTVAVLPPMSGG